MTAKLHPNGRITITQGDDWQLNLHLFNKDSIWYHPYWKEWRKPLPPFKGLPPLLDGKGELLWKTIQVQATDSEGKPLWDSEGNPIMIDNQVPVYFPDLDKDLMWHDSEGHTIVPWLRTFDGLERLGDFDLPPLKPEMLPDRFPWKYASGYHQLQEEFIKGRVILRVVDIQGNVVLEKDNNEFINTIYFLPDDTKYLNGIYLYQLEYVTDEGEDTEERQVIQDTSFFEVTKRFTVSEN